MPCLEHIATCESVGEFLDGISSEISIIFTHHDEGRCTYASSARLL